MPGMKTVGRKTAARISAMATTGPATSSIAFKRGFLWRQAFLDMMFDRFDDDDGVVHHQADGQHQAEERKGVDGKTEQRKNRECADQRHRHRQQRNERRPPALQENKHDEHDQHQRFPKGLANFADAFGDRLASCRWRSGNPGPTGNRFFNSAMSFSTPLAASMALEPGS